MPTIQSRWRWWRLPLALFAALVSGLVVGAGWLLSDQRYQCFLTQQLSTLLAADVQVTNSQVALRHGVGIELAEKKVDLLVHLALLGGISSALERAPLVGELLARGTDLLTTLSFRVTGPNADPTVTPAVVDAVVG